MKILKTINSLKDIELIRKFLSDRPRDLLLFDLATKTGVKMIDLLSLKVRDLKYLKAGDMFHFYDGNVSGAKDKLITKDLKKTIQKYLNETGAADTDYLFKSQKSLKPLTTTSVSRLITNWFQSTGFKGETGVRSLQKIWLSYFRCNAATDENTKATFKTLKNVTLQEKVYGELFQAITSGRILPGQKLIARKIAHEMGVSLIPVREAMVRLKGSGLLYSDNKGGFITNKFFEKSVREVNKIRILNECMAAENGVKNCSPKNLSRLIAIHQEMSNPSYRWETNKTLKLNHEFHFIIYSAADMPILLNIIEGLWTRISPYLHMYIEKNTLQDISSTMKIHEGIIDGIKTRSPKIVSKWIKEDITQAMDRIFILINSM